MRRPFALYILYLLHFFLSVSAMGGGGALILKPDGSLLGMEAGWLDASPFGSYLFPGLVLFAFCGLMAGITWVGLAGNPSWHWPLMFNIYHDRYWAWTFSLYTGIIVIVWITVQMLMTRYFWLQPLIILTGLSIIICTMTPGVMKYFKVSKA